MLFVYVIWQCFQILSPVVAPKPIAVLQYSNFIQTFNYTYAETLITFIN